MRDKYDLITSRDGLFWRLEDGKKIFYLNGDNIGEEYEVARFLIQKGMSSSNAHKLLAKVKEYKE